MRLGRRLSVGRVDALASGAQRRRQDATRVAGRHAAIDQSLGQMQAANRHRSFQIGDGGGDNTDTSGSAQAHGKLLFMMHQNSAQL